MHVLIVLSALVLAGVAPFISALPRSNGDLIQSIDDDAAWPWIDAADVDDDDA